MVTREELTKAYAKEISKTLATFGMPDIQVAETIESRPGAEYISSLTLGELGISPDVLARFVSSEGEMYENQRILPMLIVPTPEKALYTNDDLTAVATDLFYVFEQGKMKLIQTSEPVPLDGFNMLYYEDIHSGYHGPDEILFNGKQMFSLTNDKLRTLALFRDTGLKVPQHCELDPKDDLTKVISTFIELHAVNGLVVKGNNGSCGNFVRLFDTHEQKAAEQYAQELFAKNKRVYLEERVQPLAWRDASGDLDWNIRALVTLSSTPEWLDGEVRYGIKDNKPKNISKGAQAAEVDLVARVTGADVNQIKECALQGAKILYDAVGGNCAGFVGLDLMVSQDGIYTLEANSGAVGGFATLFKLRQKPLTDAASRLLHSLGPFLRRNHHRAQQKYTKLPHTLNDHFTLNKFLVDLKDFTGAMAHMDQAIELDKDDAPAYYNRGVIKDNLGDHRGALDDYTRAIELDNNFAPTYNNRGIIKNNLGDSRGSLDDYTRAIELDPNLASAYYNRGNAKNNLGDHRGALDDYTLAVELDPNLASAYYNRGNAKNNLGDHRGALDDYTLAIELDPNLASAYYNRGNAKNNLGDSLGALAEISIQMEGITPVQEAMARALVNSVNMGLAHGVSPVMIAKQSLAVEGHPVISELKSFIEGFGNGTLQVLELPRLLSRMGME